jgi:flavin reductase (DIM6/NTAB) family NADH-FMN oxidoreductase RutF
MPAPAFATITRRLDYPMFIVTAADGEERDGCLVGFATHCSICPPRFLACLSDKNRTLRIANHTDQLAVHLVPRHATALARLFGEQTGDEIDKFAHCAWHEGPSSLPLLDECGSWFVGQILQRTVLGDHVGHLLEPFAASDDGPDVPLLFFRDVRSFSPGHPA